MAGHLEYESFLTSLGDFLLEHRIQEGLTQTQIAQKGNKLGQSTIAKLEGGPSKQVSLKVLFEIASAYSMPLSEIIRAAEFKSLKKKDSVKNDIWENILIESKLLSTKKREWFGKIVSELLRNLHE